MSSEGYMMSLSQFRQTARFAANLALALAAPCAFAQQITYYDFNTPQANTSQYSASCSAQGVNSALFCFNYQSAAGADNVPSPSFLSDTYPASIDPILTDNPPQSGSFYATQLTYPATGQAASMWFSVPQVVANGFTTWFAFKITPNGSSLNTADGVAFVIQNAQGLQTVYDPVANCAASGGAGPTALGAGGGCIGYGGIDNSLALELDTYANGWDPSDNGSSYNDNHIALQNCGAGLPNSPNHYTFTSAGSQSATCQVSVTGADSTAIPTLVSNPQSSTPGGGTVILADGNVHQVVVIYSGPNEPTPNQLQVYIDPPFLPGTHTPAANAVPVISGTYNLATALNLINSGTANDSAYVGFTSATGGAFEQHELMAWTFTPHTTVTQQQPLAPAGSPTYQPFPFGTHTYGVQYPPQGPSTSGVSMTVTANTVSPTLFSQLIAGTPFQGSACQVYDDTGGNCIIYSISCYVTGSNPQQTVACPAVTSVPNCIGANASSCINVKTTFNSSTTPLSPGFLQGDPFFSQISALNVSGSSATFTCTGECSVTPGQIVSVVGAQPAGFNGSFTVTSVSAPNAFLAQTAVSGSGSATTPGYLTSSNVQNIFTSYTPQNIDGTSKGTTLNFSDFVFTSITNNATTQIHLSAATNSPLLNQPDLLTATLSGGAGQLASPTGTIIFYAGASQICSSAVTTTAGNTGATCSYIPSSTTPVAITAYYQGDADHLPIQSSPLNLTPIAATPTVTWPSASAITYGQTLASSTLTGGSASFNNMAVPGSFAFTAPSTAPGAGVQPESVTFTPADAAYNSVTTTILVQVNKATPLVTWPTASAITYGQTLASSLLTGGSAKSPITALAVPGTFAFTTPAAQPTATASQSVTFTPMDTNDYNPVTGSVTVTVTPVPLATVSPSSLNFGTLYQGSIVTKTVTVSNTGDAAMTISDPLIAIVQGGNSNEFITVNLCPKSLAAGKSCTMIVAFLAGPFYTPQTATLQIKDNAAGSPQTVALSATVINPVASFSANSLRFGTVKTNSGTTTKSVTLTSNGGTALGISSFAITGANPTDFTETNTCPTSLAPKGTCSITVTFKPSASGTRTATLVVTDSAQNSPQSIPLSGTGN